MEQSEGIHHGRRNVSAHHLAVPAVIHRIFRPNIFHPLGAYRFTVIAPPGINSVFEKSLTRLLPVKLSGLFIKCVVDIYLREKKVRILKFFSVLTLFIHVGPDGYHKVNIFFVESPCHSHRVRKPCRVKALLPP